MKHKPSGFSASELFVIAAAIVAIGLIGYGIYSRHQAKVSNNSNPAVTQPTSSASTVSSAPAINSTSDLDQALQTLNQNDPSTANTSDSNQLNSQLSGF